MKGEFTYLYTPEQAREMEKAARKQGATSLELIQNASILIKDRVCARLTSAGKGKVLVVCGKGGNGADGLATALLLHKEDVGADVLTVGKEPAMEENALLHSQIQTVKKVEDFSRYSVIVDALCGAGFKGELSEEMQKVTRAINESGAFVISVDLPSGVDGATGRVSPETVRANETVCTTAYKIGAFIYPGAEYCGEVFCSCDLSEGFLSDLAVNKVFPLPKRAARSHKGSFGTVAIVAGSKNMAGAAYLAAAAAYRTGAGLVKIVTVEENREILQILLPEAVLYTYEAETPQKEILSALDGCSSVVLGPGLGKSEKSRQIVSTVLENCTLPLLLDADGLNLAAGTDLIGQYRGDILLTPHIGEAARLLNTDAASVAADPLSALRRLREECGCTVVLKDAHTLIGGSDGVLVNVTGCDGMAVGGSGDVLSGMAGTLLAQKMPVFEAAATAVWLHGSAGVLAAKKHGKRSMIASHIIESIEEILIALDAER